MKSTETSNQYPLLIYQNQEIDSANLLRLITGIEYALQRFEQKYSKPVNRLAFKTQDRFLSALLLYTAAISGRTVLPVAIYLSLEQQEVLFEEAAIDLLISDNEINNADFAVISSTIFIEKLNEPMTGDHEVYFPSLMIHENFNLIIATSGTTAKAKLVQLSQNNIRAHVKAINHSLKLSMGDRWLNCLPFSNVAGVMILFRCLLSGASHVVAESFDEKKVWHEITQGKISHISLVPIMLSRLLDAAYQKAIPDSFKLILLGGDQVSDSLYANARRAGWPILISYGMSETTSTVALSDDNHFYQLLDGFQMDVNKQGVIKLKGPAVMTTHYINDISGAPVLDQQGWFTTRDIGDVDNRGLIIHGRQDKSYTSGGQTLSLKSVEQLLENCSHINEYRLTTVRHDDWGDTLVVFVDGNVDEIENWCWQNLPAMYCPRYFFSLDQLPINEMGKILNENIVRLVEQAIASKNNSAG